VLPDALGRAVPLALERAYAAGVPLPEPLLWPWSSLHEPAGWLLVGALLALAFVPRDRGRVLAALWTGGALHTAVDVLQGHHGEGYLLLAPFTDRSYELGWIGSEATVPYALPLAALAVVAWIPWVVGRTDPAWRAVPVVAVAAGALVAAVGWTAA
jgi:hypothetical protein